MQAKKKYEEEILRRVQQLPEEQLPKVISLIEKLEQEAKGKQNYVQAIEEAWGFVSDGLSGSEEFSQRKEEEKRLDK